MVVSPRYSQVRSPIRSTAVKRTAKRLVGCPPNVKKARIEVELERVIREDYDHWISLEKKYDEAWFLTYCGKRATECPRNIPKNHRGTYTAEKHLEVCEYIAACGVSVCQASKDFNIPKSTIQDIKSSSSMPPNGKTHRKGAGRPLSYSPEKEQTIVSWILEMQDLHLPVSIAEVKEKAREVVGEDNPKFKASNGWIQKFFK